MDIPKIIHLCWFSNEPYPALIEKCIDSWRKVLPDYEIKCWTYEMAVQTGIPFVKEALSERKWAFAADVIRVYALYNEGGIYMDSDIFLKRRFDCFLTNNFVSFQEYHPNLLKRNTIKADGTRMQENGPIPGIGIQAAFMASMPQHNILKNILEYYINNSFLLGGGKLNMDIIAPSIYAMEAEKLGYLYLDKTQHIGDITVYESKYLAGCLSEDNQDAFAIHCCNNSWKNQSFSAILINWIQFLMSKVGIKKKKLPLEYLSSLVDNGEEMVG